MADSSKNFLANHKRRIKEEAAEHKQAQDDFSRHYEEFSQPWDDAWRILAEIIERWATKPTDDDRRRLAGAVRRVARLAKPGGYEEKIRVATRRCQKLSELDPSGNQSNDCKISDKAAILTILLAALENESEIEQLVNELAIENPFVDVRFEVEHARQIVTLQSGPTPNAESVEAEDGSALAGAANAEILPPYEQKIAEIDANALENDSQSHDTAIPAEHRTKVMTKKKAAGLLGRLNPDSGVKWLNNCIKDGIISCEKINRQTFVFDERQFSKVATTKPK